MKKDGVARIQTEKNCKIVRKMFFT